MGRRYTTRASVDRSVWAALARDKAERLSPMPNPHKTGTAFPHSWRINVAGNCQSPRTILRDGVKTTYKGHHLFGPKLERPTMTETIAPCRVCPACLRRRAAHWSLRAQTEWRQSVRTWFGTLTLSPESHLRTQLRWSADYGKANGVDFATLDTEASFLARHSVLSKEITDFVKRVRKNSEAELRFLCVTEAHKNGLPHYHMLVHEVGPAPVRKAVLEKAWFLGFSNWRLVTDARAASYVTKYLAKSSVARVRASIDYGNNGLVP